ncbi:MAG: hypothetical protein IJ418_16410 [Clostridia bacterium]|nr:hypothetical protein [Clostridia bacterium]
MNTLKIEALLAKKYGYKPLPDDLSKQYREYFVNNTPDFLAENKSQPLYTTHGTLICDGFRRIVVGDYGAFVEFNLSQANDTHFRIAPGQEYRVKDPKYANVKYHWYTIPDQSNIKIYFQKNRVTYADYIPGMYYVSVHEVRPERGI